MELLTVIVIIMILSVVFVQAQQGWQQKAEQAKCLMNLKSLYAGASGYVQDQQHWPQIDTTLATENSTEFARQWYAALSPYSISPAIWVCPTAQRSMGNPDLYVSANMRVDYVATPFDNGRLTPYRWTTQPWFIEKTSTHPGGNQMVFEDGTTLSLVDAIRRPTTAF
jgi:type II secretory pathway pseudopilin PulG